MTRKFSTNQIVRILPNETLNDRFIGQTGPILENEPSNHNLDYFVRIVGADDRPFAMAVTEDEIELVEDEEDEEDEDFGFSRVNTEYEQTPPVGTPDAFALSTQFSYVQPMGHNAGYVLKVKGENGTATDWLPINEDQMTAIYDILRGAK